MRLYRKFPGGRQAGEPKVTGRAIGAKGAHVVHVGRATTPGAPYSSWTVRRGAAGSLNEGAAKREHGPMAVRAHGRMVFWEGASMWVLGTRPGDGPYPKTRPHCHHAVQVTLLLRGWFVLETDHQQVSGPAAAVAPDTEHAFLAEGAVAHVFVDPEGRTGRELQRVLFGGASLVSIPGLAEVRAQLLAAFDSPRREDRTLIDLGRAAVAELAPESDRDLRPDARVRRMSTWAAARLDAPVSLVDAAAHVGLSTGRARHLFVEQTGLPFRTYLLWQRLTRAVELYSGGSSLTDAAHGAGFSDSAHLSRTFRRMFGVAADSLRVM
jgi:AraC family transcriptional regulator